MDTIYLLLEKEISVNLASTYDSTPLRVPAQFGHLEVTKTLVNIVVAINNFNNYCDIPLTLATRKGI